MKRKSFFVISVIILVLIFSILFFAFGSAKYDKEKNDSVKIIEESTSCSEDYDCDDGNAYTIDYCYSEQCSNTEVVLCYQNDGCCPKSCTPANDGDC